LIIIAAAGEPDNGQVEYYFLYITTEISGGCQPSVGVILLSAAHFRLKVNNQV
jgi:hypothetical protein